MLIWLWNKSVPKTHVISAEIGGHKSGKYSPADRASPATLQPGHNASFMKVMVTWKRDDHFIILVLFVQFELFFADRTILS